MRSAVDAVRRVLRDGGDGPGSGAAAVAAALARGALLGARGNSGVILSQVLRGVAEARARPVAGPSTGGARARRRARSGRTGSPPPPSRGPGRAPCSRCWPRRPGRPSRPAPTGSTTSRSRPPTAAGAALRATTGQLPELARAGVVDAGGLGLYLVLDALAGLVSGRAGGGDCRRRTAGADGARTAAC